MIMFDAAHSRRLSRGCHYKGMTHEDSYICIQSETVCQTLPSNLTKAESCSYHRLAFFLGLLRLRLLFFLQGKVDKMW